MSRTAADAKFIPLRIAVITISDSRTAEDDTSGDYLAAELAREGHRLAQRKIVQDDRYVLRAEVLESVYRWPVVVAVDPVTGSPRVTPLEPG